MLYKHPLIDSCFYILAMVDTAIDPGVQGLQILLLFPVIHLQMELLNSTVMLPLTLHRTAKLFSTKAEPLYIPSSTAVEGFQFLTSS